MATGSLMPRTLLLDQQPAWICRYRCIGCPIRTWCIAWLPGIRVARLWMPLAACRLPPASLNALVTYFKASNTEATDEFGYSLALSGDGKTLAVRAPEEDSQSSLIDGSQGNDGYSVGAVYVFHHEENGNWAFQSYVKPSDADRGGCLRQFSGPVSGWRYPGGRRARRRWR